MRFKYSASEVDLVPFNREASKKSLLLLLDIPRPSLPHEPEDGIGPCIPDYFRKYSLSRRKQEANASAAIDAMGDEELSELCESSGRQELFAFDFGLLDSPAWYDGGFNVVGFTADFDYWSKMEFWTLEETGCLSLGFIPQAMPNHRMDMGAPNEVLSFYWARQEQIRRGPFDEVGLVHEIAPKKFVTWAKRQKIEIPDGLINSVEDKESNQQPQMLKTVDRRKYNSALKVILGFIASGHGYREGEISGEIKSDIMIGLSELRLAIDPKTLESVLKVARSSQIDFQMNQQKRDAKGP